ncbi:MAG TPA: phosphatase domain-containing protein [Candidatus Binatia bacterium]|nr:phosphatase domain-containing protein [Candidatus Binatia bacterium]
MIARAEKLSDKVRARLRKITGFNYPLMIIPYLGYGSADKLMFGGRVLEDEGFTPGGSADHIWRNLVNMYRRFESDEVPGARVRARFQGTDTEATSDEEGYFNFTIQPTRRLEANRWQEVELELLEPTVPEAPPVRATARVLAPSAEAKFGIISDIDDTVISSHVGNKLKMLLTVLLSNEHTRKPFEGVAGFYQALQLGADAREDNPIFYVSNSAWNLYPVLLEFLKLQKIPLGPLLLRDFGDHLLFSKEPESHKKANIKMILESFPHLPFVLIGDSGERDPEIYRDVVKDYPTRIRAVYIRSVNKQNDRLAAIDKLIEEISYTGTQLVLSPDSEFAAAHAAAEGLISTALLTTVRSEKQKDQNAPTQHALTR